MKVSIIIPVFNNARYIRRTLECLVSQTYKDYEIIIVDNFSSDGSVNICNDYKNKFKLIRIIEQKSNPSEARNIGIDKALGEYIVFFDSDDIISPLAIEKMINVIENCDIGIFSHSINYIKNDKTITREIVRLKNNVYYSNTSEFIEDSIGWLNRYSINPVWNKIYRKSLIIENNIRFNESCPVNEDFLFNISCIKFSLKIVTSSEIIYDYCFRLKRNSSQTNKFDPKTIQMQIETQKSIISFYESKNCKNKYIYLIALKVVFILFSSSSLSKNIMYKEKRELVNIILNNYDIKKWTNNIKNINCIGTIIYYIYKIKSVIIFIIFAKITFYIKYNYRNIAKMIIRNIK